MSSLRNAVKRREHRERAQVGSRKQLGLLEKKKDYRLRADDFNKKKRTIRHLQNKASEKNPDEFYFAMENTSTRHGVHVARTTVANKYSQEELAMMRTQDSGYLRLKAQAEAKKTERLQATLHCIGESSSKQHTRFVDAEESSGDDATLQPDNDASDGEAVEAVASIRLDTRTTARVSRSVRAQYKELLQRQARCTALQNASSALDLQRHVAGKGSKTKIKIPGGKGGALWRWRNVRKK